MRTLCIAILLAVSVVGQQRTIFRGDTVTHLVGLSSPGFEAKPDISADKLTLHFASASVGTVGGLDLWVSTRPAVGAPWGPKVNVTVLNSTERDHTPTTSPDQTYMVYSSSRAGGLGTDDCWQATRASAAAPWNPPTHVPIVSSPDRDMGFTMTADTLTLYFTSNRAGVVGGFDLFMSTRPDTASGWGPPVPVAELNTPWDDKFPSVTGDNLTLYFASNRPGGVIGALGTPSLDLWVAMRPDVNSPWSFVENVYEVNTPDSEYLMSVADDGSELYFVSDRPGILGIFDLFSTTALPQVRRYGAGVSGELGVPRLRPVGGLPSLGNAAWGYEVSNVSPFALGIYAVSLGQTSSPFLVDLNQSAFVTFQQPSFLNPPGDQVRFIPAPIPSDPFFLGLTTSCQVILAWDLQGQGVFSSIPYAASRGLERTILP